MSATSMIVTGVDGTDTAAAAAHQAAELAQALGADLHLVSAYGKYDEKTYSSGGDTFHYSNEQANLETATAAAATLGKDFPELTITAESLEGDPAEALVRAAVERKAGLIVVGNKRVQGISRVLGSIARDVIAKSPCDVYIAHTHSRG